MTSTNGPAHADRIIAEAVAWQSSPVFVVWDVDGTVRAASESYAALLGRTPLDVIGRRWPDLVDDEAELCWQQLRFTLDALATSDVFVADMPTTASGQAQWFRWTEWAVRDPSGAITQVRSTAVDVTELHEARAVLGSMIDGLAEARALGRRDVVDQLHNGAVQQLAAARWAVAAGDREEAGTLIDAALAAIRSSMDSLDPPGASVPPRLPPTDPMWRQMRLGTTDGALPEPLRSMVVDAVASTVAIVSSTGSIWLEPSTRSGMFDLRTDVDLATLIAGIHPDDRVPVAQAIVRGLGGEEARVPWRFRHRTAGWRQMYSWLAPLPVGTGEPRLAVALTMDITRVDGDPVHDVMAARLDERQRVARDLHDDVLQLVAGLRWMLDDAGAGDDVLDEVGQLETALRDRLWQLDTPVQRFGLERSLLHLVDETATPTRLEVTADVDDLPPALADLVWRCAREALRNVDRHARAGEAAVAVQVAGGGVVLTVVDDGVGVETGELLAAQRSGHLGVASMREAAAVSGGTFEMRRGDAGGTVLRIEVPVR